MIQRKSQLLTIKVRKYLVYPLFIIIIQKLFFSFSFLYDIIIMDVPTHLKKIKRAKSTLLNKPCKNHYGRGLDACSEMMPFCCAEDTLAHGSCRMNADQCSTIGIKEEKSKPTRGNVPKSSLQKPIRKVTQDEKERSGTALSLHGKKARDAMLKGIVSKAPGCNNETLQYLGPFGADNIMLFYEHELHVHPKYLKGIEIYTLCHALNKAIKSYNLNLINQQQLSLHQFLKTNIIDYLLQELRRQETSDYVIWGVIPMDDSPE
jgi:hypothetical protein